MFDGDAVTVVHGYLDILSLTEAHAAHLNGMEAEAVGMAIDGHVITLDGTSIGLSDGERTVNTCKLDLLIKILCIVTRSL